MYGFQMRKCADNLDVQISDMQMNYAEFYTMCLSDFQIFKNKLSK